MVTGESDGPPYPRSPFRQGITNHTQSSVALVHSVISEVKTVISDPKLARPGEIKKAVNYILGSNSDKRVSVDDIKRTKAKLTETASKAMEVKDTMDEAMAKMDKYLNSPIRKRTGSSIARPGSQNRSDASGTTKSERTKPSGSNRKLQGDTKNVGPSRISGSLDRTKDLSKLTNGGSPSEDKSQGWEKPNLKKKRSGPSGLTRSVDSDRERKQGSLFNRLKPTTSSSRYGASLTGTSSSEQGSPHPIPRSSLENGNIRRERVDKEGGVNLKAINKLIDNDDGPTTSSLSRVNPIGTTRGPRSNPKPSGSFRVPRDSDESTGPSSIPKRAKPAQTPSSPVKQWGSQSQRPPKSRIARRSNLPSIGTPPETGPHLSESQTTSLKKSSISEGVSEEPSQRAKDTPKRKRFVDMEGASGPASSSQKMGSVGSIQKKNKAVIADEEIVGDAAPAKKRGGGRGSGPPKPVRPASVEKSEGNSPVPTTTKQRSARSGSDRGGRPPAQKFSERKGKSRAKDASSGSPSTPGQAEDDKEELLAAAKAALDPGYAPNDVLWKKAEPYFRLVTDEDLSFLQNEITSADEHTIEEDLKKKGKIEDVSPDVAPNGHGPAPISNGDEILADRDPITDQQGIMSGDAESKAGSSTNISLSQLLMSAIIDEDEIEMIEPSNGLDSNGYTDDLMEEWTTPLEPSRTMRPPNGITLHEASTSTSGPSSPYEQMSLDERILFELHQIGVYPDIPDTSDSVRNLGTTNEKNNIEDELARLQAQLAKHSAEKKTLLVKVEEAAITEKDSQHSEFVKRSLDNLVLRANEKLQAANGRHGSKAAKQSAQDFMLRTLARCEEFDKTGKSPFDGPEFKELLETSISKMSDPSLYTDADPSQDQGKEKRKRELSLNEISGGESSMKRRKTSTPTSSTKGTNAKAKPMPKPKQKREGLPPLYPKKQKGKKNKQPEEEQKEDAEKEVEGGMADLPLPDADPTTGAQGGQPDWLNLDGAQEVDSIGLDVPMDDLFGLDFF